MNNQMQHDNNEFIKSAAFYYASQSHGKFNESLYKSKITELCDSIKPSNVKQLLKG